MHPLRKLLEANKGRHDRRVEFKMNAEADSAEVFIYDAIVSDAIEAEYWGGVAPEPFVKSLRAITASTIHVRLNSPGGSVFAARAIEQALRDHPARVVVHIDGYAASAASFLMMAADEIVASPGALVMIHNGWTYAFGNASELRSTADLLDKVDGTLVSTYAARTKQDPKQIADWMAAETWFTAEEAMAVGLVDSIFKDSPSAQVQWDLSAYNKAPQLPVADPVIDPAVAAARKRSASLASLLTV